MNCQVADCNQKAIRRIHSILLSGGFILMRLVLFISFIGPVSVRADISAEAEGPAKVTVGTHINRINEIHLEESRFEIDFYIWFLWADSDLRPGETFEVVNGHIQSRVESDIHPVEGGQHACYRVVATIIKEFDLFKYPRDRHQLAIEIEDSTSVKELVYVADVRNSVLSRDFFVPGFAAGDGTVRVDEHVYSTNYGDPNLAEDTESLYSRFIAGFEIHRPSGATALKLYIGVFVAAMIGFISLLARSDQTEVRFGLGSAALFAAIATQFVIATNMPEATILTVPDLV